MENTSSNKPTGPIKGQKEEIIVPRGAVNGGVIRKEDRATGVNRKGSASIRRFVETQNQD